DPTRRRAFADLLLGPSAAEGEPSAPGGSRPELLDDGLAMIRDHELDAVVVATPNDQHVPYAVAAMERGLPLLVEKPVATTMDGLRARWQAERARPAGRTVVGFVLRYTPFYERVREIVRSGRLGEILAVQSDENLGTGLTMVQYQGWRQDVSRSGGWMLEECCHDLDVLGYVLDSHLVRGHSLASALAFRPPPSACGPSRCSCPASGPPPAPGRSTSGTPRRRRCCARGCSTPPTPRRACPTDRSPRSSSPPAPSRRSPRSWPSPARPVGCGSSGPRACSRAIWGRRASSCPSPTPPAAPGAPASTSTSRPAPAATRAATPSSRRPSGARRPARTA